MSDIKFVVLFNGTNNDDKDKAVTNVVKMRDGLVQDGKQFVVYHDGVGNDQDWWFFTRWYAQATGAGGGWIMDEAYKQILQKLIQAHKDGTIKNDDVIHFSVSGFSRGAAMARHFGKLYLADKLQKDLQKNNITVKFRLESEYLFDTVPSFGIGANIWLFSKMGIDFQKIDIGWDFTVPAATKVYHALAIDELRDAFTPRLVDYVKDMIEEVWFEGDHSTVGGGHQHPEATIMADRNTLRYMVSRAAENGLRFKPDFLAKFKTDPSKEWDIGEIKTPDWATLPPTQRGPRKIFIAMGSSTQEVTPIIAESTLKRMLANFAYRPAPLMSLTAFRVLKDNGEIEVYDAKRILSWKAQLQKEPDSAKVLTFRDPVKTRQHSLKKSAKPAPQTVPVEQKEKKAGGQRKSAKK